MALRNFLILRRSRKRPSRRTHIANPANRGFFGRALRWLFRAPVYLYRWKCGWLLGHRFLLLIHVGRRTGRRRYTVLEIVEYRKEGPEAVVISAFGPNADWFRNIEATPGAEVVIGSLRFPAAHRILDEQEAVRVLGGYEQRNRLIAPIIRRVLSRLLGWPYDGSENHRRRLATQLPFIAFARDFDPQAAQTAAPLLECLNRNPPQAPDSESRLGPGKSKIMEPQIAMCHLLTNIY